MRGRTLDSSILVAALATPNTAFASRTILAAAATGAVRLVITDELEAEYRRAVEYPRVVRYSAKLNRQAFVSAVVAVAVRVEGGEAAGVAPGDPADDMVMAAAFGGRADFVVSLDRHLLGPGEVRGVRVPRPGDFLRELRAERD